MNTYIVFRLEGLEKFTCCIAPYRRCGEHGEWEYDSSEVELVTASTVEPFPSDGREVCPAWRERDRENALRKARRWIADWLYVARPARPAGSQGTPPVS